MSIKKILGILVILSVYEGVSATDITLTLKNVVDLAVKQGTSPLRSQNQIKQRELAIQKSSSDFLPELKSSLSTNTGGNLNDRPWSSSAGASVDLSYTFNPSSIPSHQSTTLQGKAAQYQYKQVINDITLSASQSYIQALYALKKIEIAKNNVEVQKTKLQQIEEYRTAGKTSIADVLQQKTTVAEGEASLLEAQQTFVSLRLTILDIAGLSLDSQLNLDTTELSSIVNAILASDTIAKKIDLKTIPQIQSKTQTLSSVEFDVKSAQMSYLPSISSSLSAGANYGGLNGHDHTWADPTGRISLSLSYPLYDHNNRKQNVQKAGLELEAAKLELQEAEKSALLNHSKTMYDLEIAKKGMDVAEARLTAAKQSLDATTQRYEAGASTLVEVSMVNNSYLNAVNSKLQAESDILIAYVKMLHQNGQVYDYLNKNLASK